MDISVIFRRGTLTAIAVLACLAPTVATAQAGQETPDPAPTARPADEPYCAVFLSKERDENGLSKVLSTECSTTSMEDAHAEAKASAADQAVGTADNDVLLANEYKDADYGTLLYSFFGYEPCDSDGYTVRNFGHVANNVSSIKGYNDCNSAELTDGAPPWTEYFNLPVSYIGDRLNDDVDYMHVYYG